MTIAILTLLILASVAVVALPFLRQRSHDNDDDEIAEIAYRLRRARNRVYEEIRTLQQEYFLKNVTEDQYREQLREARLQAAQLARQQHEVQETLASIEQAVDAEMAEALRPLDEELRATPGERGQS